MYQGSYCYCFFAAAVVEELVHKQLGAVRCNLPVGSPEPVAHTHYLGSVTCAAGGKLAVDPVAAVGNPVAHSHLAIAVAGTTWRIIHRDTKE